MTTTFAATGATTSDAGTACARGVLAAPTIEAEARATGGRWDSRVHDWRDHATHMILVAKQAVLTRRAGSVTGLAEFFLHRTKVGHEVLRIALLVALQIGAALLEVMAGQATAVLQNAEMRLMDEIREVSLLARHRRRREIDEPPLAPDVVDAVAFRA
jgi:hypothetical protein